MSDLSPGLLRTLAVLRWFAVGGQAITLIVVIHVLHVPLTPAPLWFAVAALALFNLWASARARRVPSPSSLEILGHLSVDVAILTWLIVRTGARDEPLRFIVSAAHCAGRGRTASTLGGADCGPCAVLGMASRPCSRSHCHTFTARLAICLICIYGGWPRTL